ncbi:unnamed protein product [Cyprideis torosa]|uniref:Uncharacterized protein n=1 Tax=Cyprideis torosa TaxID=163714 RepID=A0A7R8W6P9_9CRUS|nr:unnamed protein product [Cyprideis torosa]CAG0881300.1 unnamed protein product [Cyprideis torosa]
MTEEAPLKKRPPREVYRPPPVRSGAGGSEHVAGGSELATGTSESSAPAKKKAEESSARVDGTGSRSRHDTHSSGFYPVRRPEDRHRSGDSQRGRWRGTVEYGRGGGGRGRKFSGRGGGGRRGDVEENGVEDGMRGGGLQRARDGRASQSKRKEEDSGRNFQKKDGDSGRSQQRDVENGRVQQKNEEDGRLQGRDDEGGRRTPQRRREEDGERNVRGGGRRYYNGGGGPRRRGGDRGRRNAEEVNKGVEEVTEAKSVAAEVDGEREESPGNREGEKEGRERGSVKRKKKKRKKPTGGMRDEDGRESTDRSQTDRGSLSRKGSVDTGGGRGSPMSLPLRLQDPSHRQRRPDAPPYLPPPAQVELQGSIPSLLDDLDLRMAKQRKDSLSSLQGGTRSLGRRGSSRQSSFEHNGDIQWPRRSETPPQRPPAETDESVNGPRSLPPQPSWGSGPARTEWGGAPSGEGPRPQGDTGTAIWRTRMVVNRTGRRPSGETGHRENSEPPLPARKHPRPPQPMGQPQPPSESTEKPLTPSQATPKPQSLSPDEMEVKPEADKGTEEGDNQTASEVLGSLTFTSKTFHQSDRRSGGRVDRPHADPPRRGSHGGRPAGNGARKKYSQMSNSKESSPQPKPSGAAPGCHERPRTASPVPRVAEDHFDWAEEVEREDREDQAAAASAKTSSHGRSNTTSVSGKGDRRLNSPKASYASATAAGKRNRAQPGGRGVSGSHSQRQGSSPATDPSHGTRDKAKGGIDGPSGGKGGGIIRLNQRNRVSSQSSGDFPVGRMSPSASVGATAPPGFIRPTVSVQQRTLYDPKNPSKPQVVTAPVRRDAGIVDYAGAGASFPASQPDLVASYVNVNQPPPNFGNFMGAPADGPPAADGFLACPGNRSESMIAVDNAMSQLTRGDQELTYIAGTGTFMAQWERVLVIRSHLLRQASAVMAAHLKHTLQSGLDGIIVECLRTESGRTEDPAQLETISNRAKAIVDEGTAFYLNELRQLEKMYEINMDDFLSQFAVPRPPNISLALVLAHKHFLSLGDLERYKQQIWEVGSQADNALVSAEEFYHKAQTLCPKNGRCYNQLALVAWKKNRQMECAYYYSRALMAKNPHLSGRENLLLIFHDNVTKAEGIHRRPDSPSAAFPCRGRWWKELWLRPDNECHRDNRLTSNSVPRKKENFKEVERPELMRRFHLEFLASIGKLYTNVNMELFQPIAVSCLKAFRELLSCKPLPINLSRLLQLSSMPMFVLSSYQPRENLSSLDEGAYQSLQQEQCIRFTMEFLAVLFERAAVLAKAHLQESGTVGFIQSMDLDLDVLLATAKFWCEWLLRFSKLYNPPSINSELRVTPFDVWTAFATLSNVLTDVHLVEMKPNPEPGYQLVSVAEDKFAAGFYPLIDMVPDAFYVPEYLPLTHGQRSIRVWKLQLCRDYLMGLDPRMIKYDKRTTSYISVVSTTEEPSSSSLSGSSLPSTVRAAREAGLTIDSSEEEEEEEEGAELMASGGASDSTTGEGNIPDEKKLLWRMMVEQERNKGTTTGEQRWREEALARELASAMDVVVRPKYIVPDTNTFLDHLISLRAIARGGVYQLLVPFAVVEELEVLAKRNHDQKKQKSAGSALEFLRAEPASRGGLRFVTSDGTFTNSCVIVTENDSRPGSNDDRILRSCVRFIQSRPAPAVTLAHRPGTIFRDTILLTEDRILRLKASSEDIQVPVRRMSAFLKWADLK